MPSIIRSLIPVALHTVTMYLFLVLGLRLIGRRQLGQLTVVDLVILILLGSAVETAMVAGNTTLWAGLVSAGTLFAVNRLLALLSLRSHRVRRLVAGETLLLINDGTLMEENLRRAGMTQDDLLEALRERGCADLEEVRYAVREADGAVNVIPCGGDTAPRQSATVIGSRDSSGAQASAAQRPS